MSYNTVAEKIGTPSLTTNTAGGVSHAVSNWDRLNRFLVLGSDSNQVYQTALSLTEQNAKCVLDCIAEDGLRTVKTIVEISDGGRASKNEPALFALALCAGHAASNVATRKAALAALPKVARIGTHLFQFVAYVDKLRGWGRSLKTGVASWYNSMPADRLALQVIKYAGRNTEEGTASSRWSHDDVLRLSHPYGDNLHNMIYEYVTKEGLLPREVPQELRILDGVRELKIAGNDAKAVARIVTDYNLPHEVIPKELGNNPMVWEALLPNLGFTALLRNLNRLTSYGVLTPLGTNTKAVTSRLTDLAQLRKARIHPVGVLNALRTYSQGRGDLGSLTWNAIPQIQSALDTCLEMSFKTVEPTGKNILLGLDVSGSMTGGAVAGLKNITPREAVAVMATVTARVEPNYHILGFCHKLVDLGITAKDSFLTVMSKVQKADFGSTNCSLMFEWALANRVAVDGFVMYTDNEHNTGENPDKVFRKYRGTRSSAKAIAVATTATQYSVFNPESAGTLNMAGFDASAPSLIADFIRN